MTNVLTTLTQIINRVCKSIFTSGIGPARISRTLFAVAFAFTLISMAGNSLVRLSQFNSWQETENSMHKGSATLFSTADAPYFLKQASLIKDGQSSLTQESVRSFPNNLTFAENKATQRSSDAPHPLAFLLAFLAENNERETLLTSGNHMIIFTAAITSLMITCCFGAAGYWLEGAIAGLGGGLSSAYLLRSSIGRIDTDQLNLGLFYLIFAFLIAAGRAKSKSWCILHCIFAGICANLFMWWYPKPELVVVASVSLFWIVACLQRSLLTATVGVTIFIGLSGIALFNPLATAYLQETLATGVFTFPNTLKTITEVREIPLLQILVHTTGSIEMGFVCLTGLTFFLFRHPLIAIAYGPLVIFGLLNFVIGNRAIFYSAPILWFGASFLLTTAGRFIATNSSNAGFAFFSKDIATITAASVAMTIAWVNSPTDYVPRPSFPKPVLEGLASLKSTADPTNSVVATWWDYGYASMFFNDLPTFHDGGSQNTPTTYFVAAALLDTEQIRSVGRLKFLSTEGHKGIAAEQNVDGLQTKFDQAINAPSPDIYLVVTSQMAGWMGSISQIGNWDIERGEPVILRGNRNGPLVSYERLNCRLGGYPETLTCSGAAFDLERGLVNGAPILAGWAHSQNGTVVRNKTFNHDGDLAVQIIQTGNRINVFLMHRQLFESSFNELFYLGQIEHPSISLHYDNYPHIRIYRIHGEPAS